MAFTGFFSAVGLHMYFFCKNCHTSENSAKQYFYIWSGNDFKCNKCKNILFFGKNYQVLQHICRIHKADEKQIEKCAEYLVSIGYIRSEHEDSKILDTANQLRKSKACLIKQLENRSCYFSRSEYFKNKIFYLNDVKELLTDSSDTSEINKLLELGDNYKNFTFYMTSHIYNQLHTFTSSSVHFTSGRIWIKSIELI